MSDAVNRVVERNMHADATWASVQARLRLSKTDLRKAQRQLRESLVRNRQAHLGQINLGFGPLQIWGPIPELSAGVRASGL